MQGHGDCDVMLMGHMESVREDNVYEEESVSKSVEGAQTIAMSAMKGQDVEMILNLSALSLPITVANSRYLAQVLLPHWQNNQCLLIPNLFEAKQGLE